MMRASWRMRCAGDRSSNNLPSMRMLHAKGIGAVARSTMLSVSSGSDNCTCQSSASSSGRSRRSRGSFSQLLNATARS